MTVLRLLRDHYCEPKARRLRNMVTLRKRRNVRNRYLSTSADLERKVSLLAVGTGNRNRRGGMAGRESLKKAQAPAERRGLTRTGRVV